MAMFVVVGLRVLWPIDQVARDAGTRRRQNRPLLVASAAGVGVFTGLLANGGGFLLVPLNPLVPGLRMPTALPGNKPTANSPVHRQASS